MALSCPCTPILEKASTVRKSLETPIIPTWCVPGCFTCANGDEHPPHSQTLTPFEEFLLIMENHRQTVRLQWDKINSQIQAIRIERVDPDLEPGHDELRELEQVRYNYTNALCDIEDGIAQAKRASMYENLYNEECEDNDEEDIDELGQMVGLAESKEDMPEHLPSLPETPPDSSKS